MGKIIAFKDKKNGPPDNLIISKPWEFRRADWYSRHFIQMLRSQSTIFENHRKEIYEKGFKGIWHLPPHLVLKNGAAHTIQHLYGFRFNESKMRETYYLAGLIDGMINQVNPLLRTDLVRDLFNKIMTLKKILCVNWYGQIDQVLLPIDPQFFNHVQYRASLSKAMSMKEFYDLIREGMDKMFEIFSCQYIFFTPGKGV